jgi:hypothetical protein
LAEKSFCDAKMLDFRGSARLAPMLQRSRVCIVAAALVLGLAACGGRSSILTPSPAEAGGTAPSERCDGRDQDGDGRVDEDFRDPQGRYVDRLNCGSCGHACLGALPNAIEVGCQVIGEQPVCAATRCAGGFGPSQSGSCVALDDHLCLGCLEDGDCGTLAGARCVDIAGEMRCARACGDGCPSGYVCEGADHCAPAGGSCDCNANEPDFSLACTAFGNGGNCVGIAQCKAGTLSECRAPDEICDGADNDCDGKIDETFVDSRGAYSRDLRNCGACGADCTADVDAGLDLTCGGDPFAPSCVHDCPDAADGIQIGDFLDADRELDNGCECRVTASRDDPGGDPLDADCDGADGKILNSFYVSVDGDDSGPGSPTRPLRHIDTAIERAAATFGAEQQRLHVFVASGVYTETVHMRDGVSLHGGYRSDFLAQSTDGFEVIVVAPSDTDAPLGAALTSVRAGFSPTLIEGISFRGRDALGAGEPAAGIDLQEPGVQLVLRHVRVSSGKPGAGNSGIEGAAGSGPSTTPTDGSPPRAAVENAAHTCIAGFSNRVIGGSPGNNICDGVDVSGGTGGASTCPSFGSLEGAGVAGQSNTSVGGSPGIGGVGGRDLSGPIQNDNACPTPVCCGLADFTVPNNVVVLPGAGLPGSDGSSGVSGSACSDPLGSFSFGTWTAGSATDGTNGTAGGGGGGGGAGGGVEMQFIDGSCEFPDGLGGAGGGGGAGGCGGKGGRAGRSGGIAIGVLIRAVSAERLPVLDGVEIITHDGGAGGAGGAGGDGGRGGSGGFGGELPDRLRSSPPLAGPVAGERGGKGGDGGGGGGGGGGCGGSSLGVWVTGLGMQPDLRARFRSGNAINVGEGGAAGLGGGGPAAALDGAAGLSLDVLVR